MIAKKLFMEAADRLRNMGVSMTRPRIAILQYLMDNHIHPTIDKIYLDLKNDYPSLSRTTIYNSVKFFSELGLVQILYVGGKQVCVDETTDPHGHLLCTECGRVFDIPMQERSMINRRVGGHLITETHQYYIGLCKECLMNK